MAKKTFNRFEYKYLVTSEQFRALCQAFKGEMVLDKYCKDGQCYTIYNLYFDTDNNSVIRRSLEKPYYKEKLRLRSYKLPTAGTDTVFLELKKKIGGIVIKRRAVMSYDEALRFCETGVPPQSNNYQDTQVNLEIADFLNRYTVYPKVYIRYERAAFFHHSDPELRISFDRRILTRRTNVSLLDGDYGAALLAKDCYIMEIKCIRALPLWLCHSLSSLKVYKSSFSKYGTEYGRYIRFKRKHAA